LGLRQGAGDSDLGAAALDAASRSFIDAAGVPSAVRAYLPGKIKATVRHPMLAAIKFWALAHLIANGDLASIILFGSFLAYAVVDRILLKSRGGAAPVMAVSEAELAATT
jgi:uncharacterized membrane protein